jgi:hypothetical protein
MLYANTIATSNIYASTLNVSTIYQNASYFYPNDMGVGGMVFTDLSGNTTGQILNDVAVTKLTLFSLYVILIFSFDFLILRSNTTIKIDAPTLDISANSILVHTTVGGSISMATPTLDISANYINTNAIMSTNSIQANTIDVKTSMTAPQTLERSQVATNRIIPYWYSDNSYTGTQITCDSNTFTQVLTGTQSNIFPNLSFSNYRFNFNANGYFVSLDSNTSLSYYFQLSNIDTTSNGNGYITNSNYPYRLYNVSTLSGISPINTSFGYNDVFDTTNFANNNFTLLLYINPSMSFKLSNYSVQATFEPILSL